MRSSGPRRHLDTDILIDIQRRHPAALAWFRTVGPGEVGIAGFVAMELVKDARNAAEARAADVLIEPLPVIWPSDEACRTALIDFRNLHLSHSLGLIDSLIAATARSAGATLCTFNRKHFRPVAGLTCEEPYIR
jgi:predicted nucleic acid-binding protein